MKEDKQDQQELKTVMDRITDHRQSLINSHGLGRWFNFFNQYS